MKVSTGEGRKLINNTTRQLLWRPLLTEAFKICFIHGLLEIFSAPAGLDRKEIRKKKQKNLTKTFNSFPLGFFFYIQIEPSYDSFSWLLNLQKIVNEKAGISAKQRNDFPVILMSVPSPSFFLVINFILPFFTKPHADAFGILLKSSTMMATLKGLKRSGQIIG